MFDLLGWIIMPVALVFAFKARDRSWKPNFFVGLGALCWTLGSAQDQAWFSTSFNGVISGVNFYVAWYLYNKDDDHKKRRKARMASLKAKFRSFAPSPIPSPA